MKLRNLAKIAVPLSLLFLYFLLSNQDYKTEIANKNHYCYMVKNDFWPDFNSNYTELCIKKTTLGGN